MSPAVAKRAREAPLVEGEFGLTPSAFKSIASALYEEAGINLPETKATLVYARLVRRLRALKLASFEQYCELIGDPECGERQMLISSLTTNVTQFFREPHHFEHLRSVALPALIDEARRGGRVRIWSAGCSTGQEPYSIAMTILGAAPDARNLDVKILATDIDADVINEASKGVYSEAALASLPSERLSRFFVRDHDSAWRVGDDLRRLVSFKRLNLNGQWPMRATFHVIFCRNVVIYFDEAKQWEIWRRFSTTLDRGGWLYIGHSERVAGPGSSRFESAGVTCYRAVVEQK